MVPLEKIRPRDGFNPRTEFDGERMAELVESVKRHGIITPLTLAPDGDGFVIVAGERRYRAAKQAKLTQVPAQVRDGDGAPLALAVAENVIRADLTPVAASSTSTTGVAATGALPSTPLSSTLASLHMPCVTPTRASRSTRVSRSSSSHD